jgi:CRP-like cAMP-binding protein
VYDVMLMSAPQEADEDEQEDDQQRQLLEQQGKGHQDDGAAAANAARGDVTTRAADHSPAAAPAASDLPSMDRHDDDANNGRQRQAGGQQQQQPPAALLLSQQQQQGSGGASAAAALAQRRATSGGLSGGGGGGSMMLDNDFMADLAAMAAGEAVMTALERGDDTGSPGQEATVGMLGGVQTEWGELVHTYVAPPLEGEESGGPHPSFGELALLYGKPRAATVVCQSLGVLWRLSRADFRAAVQQSGRGDPGQQLLRALRSCELLECLTNGQLLTVAGLLQPVRMWVLLTVHCTAHTARATNTARATRAALGVLLYNNSLWLVGWLVGWLDVLLDHAHHSP